MGTFEIKVEIKIIQYVRTRKLIILYTYADPLKKLALRLALSRRLLKESRLG